MFIATWQLVIVFGYIVYLCSGTDEKKPTVSQGAPTDPDHTWFLEHYKGSCDYEYTDAQIFVDNLREFVE